MILGPYLLKVGLILVYCSLATHQNLTGGMSIEIAAIIQRKLCNTSDANRRGDKFASLRVVEKSISWNATGSVIVNKGYSLSRI